MLSCDQMFMIYDLSLKKHSVHRAIHMPFICHSYAIHMPTVRITRGQSPTARWVDLQRRVGCWIWCSRWCFFCPSCPSCPSWILDDWIHSETWQNHVSKQVKLIYLDIDTWFILVLLGLTWFTWSHFVIFVMSSRLKIDMNIHEHPWTSMNIHEHPWTSWVFQSILAQRRQMDPDVENRTAQRLFHGDPHGVGKMVWSDGRRFPSLLKDHRII